VEEVEKERMSIRQETSTRVDILIRPGAGG
jgi:hypothetical protein